MYIIIYFLLSIVVCARQFIVILILSNIHYFVTCLGYMAPGGCVFTLKSANVFVRILLYYLVLDIYLCSVDYRM